MSAIALPQVKKPAGLQPTDIEWADYAFNPLRAIDPDTGKVGWHCEKVSAGCRSCYAETINGRFGTGLPYSAASSKRLQVVLDEQRLQAALSFRIPKGFKGKAGDGRPKVFVCDMTDLFGAWVRFDTIDRLFALFALRPDIDWMILTKRPARMAEYFGRAVNLERIAETMNTPATMMREGRPVGTFSPAAWAHTDECSLRLPNVWAGTSCEDQAAADERIPHLLACHAAIRFISAEPLLGPIDLSAYFDRGICTKCGYVGVCQRSALGLLHYRVDGTECPYNALGCNGLHQLIVGGESGYGARLCDVLWIKSIIDQCKASGTPCFVKQLGSWPMIGDISDPWGWPERDGPVNWETGRIHLRSRKGGDPEEWPDNLRVREFPEVRS